MNFKKGILATLVLFASLFAGLLWLSQVPSPVPPQRDPLPEDQRADRSNHAVSTQTRQKAPTGTAAESDPEPELPSDDGFHPITKLSTEIPPDREQTGTQPGSLREAPPPVMSSSREAQPSSRQAEVPKPYDSPSTAEPPYGAVAVKGTSRRAAAGEPAAPRNPVPAASSPSKVDDRRIAIPGVARRPAPPPGLYETITMAAARSAPSEAAGVVEQIPPGVRLNVKGSRRDWLIVYSDKRRLTVYVNRDDAMYLGSQQAQSTSASQDRWTEIERDILEVFTKYGIKGITVTFIGDTAYLKGEVKTARERERAELFTRSVPAVKHVFNGVRVAP